jgi:hypothetical protein
MDAHRGPNAPISIGVCERCGLRGAPTWLDHGQDLLVAALVLWGDCDYPRLLRAVLAVGWPGTVGALCAGIREHVR